MTRRPVADRAVPAKGQEVWLASHPHGFPGRDNFEMVTAPVAAPAENQILVRNTVMSVDPIMRVLMRDADFIAPPFRVGAPLEGGAIGEVIESRSDQVLVGATVLHHLGWREYATLNVAEAVELPRNTVPVSAYLGVLGVPGLTAYVGLFEIAKFRPGDVVFVSAAAGAVGSVAGQLAKLRGASKVIGSAGSADKVRYLTEELGFDKALNHRDGPLGEQLRAAAPEGIDVYFDNVGGDHLEAAIDAMRAYGRIAACGAVSQYNATGSAPGPRNLSQIIFKRLAIRGFVVYLDHLGQRQQFLDEVLPLVRTGRLQYRETVVKGLSNAPDALIGLLRGTNTGKMLVTF